METETLQSLSLPTAMEEPFEISLTPKAIEKVKAFAQGNKESEGKGFRVYVQGGGCSGFSYGFNFDESREGDTIVPVGDINVLVDPVSVPYLKHAVVDYTESMQGSGFSVQNPNAKGSCGCGSSFTV